MSNGLRGARKLSEADTEQTAMDNTNKETISNMDAAITGIQDWQKQREEQMLKFKRELLANEKEINSNVSPTIVKENENEGKNCSNNDDNNSNNNNNNNEDHETNFEQSIFMTDDVTYSVKNLNISSSKSNNSLTSYLKDENEDPIALAVENKLKQELKQLQEKRKIQLKTKSFNLVKRCFPSSETAVSGDKKCKFHRRYKRSFTMFQKTKTHHGAK